VRLWDFQGRQVAEFWNPKGAIWGVAFSPDSRQIAFAGDKGFVNIRSIQSLPSLMQQGCGWLRNYLESHPDEKAILTKCLSSTNVNDD
jgi:WD40 repeat protein